VPKGQPGALLMGNSWSVFLVEQRHAKMAGGVILKPLGSKNILQIIYYEVD